MAASSTFDHEAKTYTVLTTAQLQEYMQQAQAKQRSAMAQAQAEQKQKEAQKPANDSVKTEVKVDLKVDRTGEKQKIAGYDAERVFMTVTTDVTVTPQQGENAGEKQDAGRMVLLMDSWNAKNAPPEQAMKAMMEKMGPAVRQQSQKSAEAVLGMVTSDPNAKDAMEKALAEAEKAGGFEMKGTMYVVLVPAGMTFDRQLALGEAEKKGEAKKPGLGGLLKNALANKEPEKKEEKSEPRQVTMFRVLSEVREIRTTSLSASIFEPPAGYKELKFNPGTS